MSRDVLLRRAEVVGEPLRVRLAARLEVVDEAKPQRLPKHPQLVGDQFDQRTRDRAGQRTTSPLAGFGQHLAREPGT